MRQAAYARASPGFFRSYRMTTSSFPRTGRGLTIHCDFARELAQGFFLDVEAPQLGIEPPLLRSLRFVAAGRRETQDGKCRTRSQITDQVATDAKHVRVFLVEGRPINSPDRTVTHQTRAGCEGKRCGEAIPIGQTNQFKGCRAFPRHCEIVPGRLRRVAVEQAGRSSRLRRANAPVNPNGKSAGCEPGGLPPVWVAVRPENQKLSVTGECPLNVIKRHSVMMLRFSLTMWAEPSHIRIPHAPGWKLYRLAFT